MTSDGMKTSRLFCRLEYTKARTHQVSYSRSTRCIVHCPSIMITPQFKCLLNLIRTAHNHSMDILAYVDIGGRITKASDTKKNTTNTTRVQAGIERPKKVHRTSAQSPVPFNTLLKTSVNGKRSSM